MTVVDKVVPVEALTQIDAPWDPRIVAAVNDYDVKLARMEGEFPWHAHPDTDELFLCVAGRLTLELRDGAITLAPGELAVVPRGVEHHPVAEPGTAALMFEPRGTPNTGDLGGGTTGRPL